MFEVQEIIQSRRPNKMSVLRIQSFGKSKSAYCKKGKG